MVAVIAVQDYTAFAIHNDFLQSKTKIKVANKDERIGKVNVRHSTIQI